MPARPNLVTIRCPDVATLRRLLRFNDGFLGRIAGISDAEALERFRSCPDAFHCVVEERRVDGSDEGTPIHGFFILLPLTADCVGRIRAAEIHSSRQIRDADLAPFDSPAGLYLSVVCASGRFARAAVIAGCLDTVAALYCTAGVPTLFARAATDEGAHMLTRVTNELFQADRKLHEVNLCAHDSVLRAWHTRKKSGA